MSRGRCHTQACRYNSLSSSSPGRYNLGYQDSGRQSLCRRPFVGAVRSVECVQNAVVCDCIASICVANLIEANLLGVD